MKQTEQRRPRLAVRETAQRRNSWKRFAGPLPTDSRFCPLGAEPASDFGNLPHPEARPISTRGLDRVIDYDPPNQVVTVGAGMTLEALQDQLRANGQWLPLRPPTALQKHSVGGVIALAACGPERAVYGAPRDLLLGLRFVSGKGRVIKTGGRVVKNVAGYDLTRLMAGSAGTLGVIIRANFRVAMIPERCMAVTADGDLDDCAAMATALITSNRIPNFVVATTHGNGRETVGGPGEQPGGCTSASKALPERGSRSGPASWRTA